MVSMRHLRFNVPNISKRRTNTAADPKIAFDVESLETRRLLAGNVVAAINASGDLIVNGDSDDNHIDIVFDELGFVSIQGNQGTTINDLGVVGPVTGDVRINMRGGDDEVDVEGPRVLTSGFSIENIDLRGAGGSDELSISGMQIDGSVFIAGGSGEDVHWIDNSQVTGDLEMVGGSGYDSFLLYDGVTAYSVDVRGGGGEDDISADEMETTGGGIAINLGTGDGHALLSVSTQDLTIRTLGANDNVTIYDTLADGIDVQAGSGLNFIDVNDTTAESAQFATGGEQDQINIHASTISGDLSVNAGNGENIVDVYSNSLGADTFLTTGNENDSIFVHENSMKYGSLTINSRGGDDEISIQDSVISGRLEVRTGGGSDYLYGKYAFAGETEILMGGGADEATLLDSTLNDLDIRMGGGNDELRLGAIIGQGVANGGGGIDDITIAQSPDLFLDIQDF